jgi:hypothetical protein
VLPEPQVLERAAGEDLRGAQAHFVRRQGARLLLRGSPFFISGANRLDLLALAADPATRAQVAEALAGARVLGVNTLRIAAFGDGPGSPAPVQPVDGWLDNTTLGALDWVVDQARCGPAGRRGAARLLAGPCWHGCWHGRWAHGRWAARPGAAGDGRRARAAQRALQRAADRGGGPAAAAD